MKMEIFHCGSIFGMFGEPASSENQEETANSSSSSNKKIKVESIKKFFII